MWRKVIAVTLVVGVMALFFLIYVAITPENLRGMGGMEIAGAPTVPPVRGFAEGEEILFLHTEASIAQVAEMLTEMMGSPVLVVPALAETPETLLATVYVFQNGIEGDGPFGFQADVFDNPPGHEGYTPLRAIHLINWVEGATPRLLRSANEVQQAEARGEITIERPGSVVNMPIIRWPGGER
jgi:hypothetical protein